MMEHRDERGRRLARFLPVLVICSIMAILYTVYMLYHCLPLLQFDIPAEYRDRGAIVIGALHLFVSHAFAAMMLWSFYMTYSTEPGRIPDTDEWQKQPNPNLLTERKRDGGLRYCHKCSKFKPDRSHHSSNSGRCVLKMDHYCPWVANDIGYFNYKFFVLTLFYSAITLIFLTATLAPTVKTSLDDANIPFEQVFFIFLGSALSFFVLAIVGPFFLFHSWLVSINSTTIEYCEKRRSGAEFAYDLGLVENIRQAMGDQVLLWLVPVGGPTGDGITFPRRR